MKLKLAAFLVLATMSMHFAYSQTENAAEQEKDTTIYLKDVIIEENRLSYSFSEASRNVEIVEKAEIVNAPMQSLPEILSYQPGVDIRQRGPLGVQADIGIRGGSFEQTLVLVNGIKMSDPQTGHHALNVPLMYDNLERIEILKGSAARIYGQNAYAGAVNFITKVPEKNAVRFRGYGGDFNSWGGNLSASFRNENQGHYVSLGSDISNGYRYNTDYEMINGFYQGEITLNSNSQIDIIAGLTDRKFGANGFYASPQAINQYEEVRTGQASVGYTYKSGRWKVNHRFSWRNNRDRYEFVRSNPGIYQNIHTTNTNALETNASYKSNLGTTGIGIEYRREEINGSWLRRDAETGQDSIASPSNLDGFSRDNVGAFLEHRFILNNGKLDITPGMYLGWYSDFGAQVFPGIEAGYNLTNFLRVYGNLGRSFRIPTFYDQYYDSPVEKGNPDLEPEEAWTYEGGIRLIKGGWVLETNAFLRDNQRMIDWVLNVQNQDSIYEARNFTMVQTRGIELSLSYNTPIYLLAGKSAIERFSLSYNNIDQRKRATEDLSRYALDHLAGQFIATVNFKLYAKLKSSLVYRHVNRVEQDAYSLWDGRIYWEDERFNIFAEATNITNTTYNEVLTRMPGRWFRAGLILNFPY